jgi:hypothetical protein
MRRCRSCGLKLVSNSTNGETVYICINENCNLANVKVLTYNETLWETERRKYVNEDTD